MREILQRRFAPGKPSPPDLLVVDGGPGQLSSALKVLRQTGLEPFPVVGMAKERRGSAKPDRLHLPGGGDPLVLPERSSALFLLQRIRDEAHRFAVRYHRKLRRARTLRSGLEEIPGVGPKRRARLLAHFGSLKAAREASVEELADVPGIPRAVAEAVAEFLHAPVPDEKGLSSGSDTS
jgi:excinuclease ABC subunit C